MRRLDPLFLVLAVAASPAVALGQPPAPPSPTAPQLPASASPSVSATPSTSPSGAPLTPSARAEAMRAYHAALLNRRLGSQDLRLEEVGARAAEAEELTSIGRVDEAISRLIDIVEHPKFELFEQTEEGRAALFRLGDALAQAGIYEPARAYFRRILAAPKAWQGNATYARRAVRRLVDIALESENFAAGADDLKDLASNPTLPDETRGEMAYMTGRADEAKGDPDAALGAYAQVTQRSRFWAQATYLEGLIQVEKGHLKEGENLFCRVADPGRQSRTTPVFADEHYFAVRDLARLALGRIAHEQGRNDDARYYYYLVPRDSDRLAQALYEAATTRYEKKDYDGARELLDELKGLGIHHPYEDEAWVLDAYIDLARCKFEDADKKLVTFVALYEPVRDGARRVAQDDRAMEQLLRAARTGSDAGGAEIGGANVSPEVMRAIAALVRLDPNYGTIVKRRAVLEHEASGLRQSRGEINDLQRELATNGGVRPAAEEEADPATRAADARAALDGVKRQLDDLDAAHASPQEVARMREEASRLEAQLAHAGAPSGEAPSGAGAAAGGDLPDLLANDARVGASLSLDVEKARQELAASEAALARDALKRVDLRLSRLLRRARLGRIESVLGRKRALEVEIEAINNGYLPQGAFDSLDAARFLQDNEEYWPFEGDDWPDEYVGSENPK